MSIHAIKQYQLEVEKIIHFGGSKKETAIRNAFYNLLNEYAKQKGLMLIPEITIKTPKGKNVTPDGTLKDSLRQDWGYNFIRPLAGTLIDDFHEPRLLNIPLDRTAMVGKLPWGLDLPLAPFFGVMGVACPDDAPLSAFPLHPIAGGWLRTHPRTPPPGRW